MSSTRKTHSADVKTKVALEAIRGEMTTNQIATRYQVHPAQVAQWKKQALAHLRDAFSSRREKAKQEDEAFKDELYAQIGRLKVELDWLKNSQSAGLNTASDNKKQLPARGEAYLATCADTALRTSASPSIPKENPLDPERKRRSSNKIRPARRSMPPGSST